MPTQPHETTARATVEQRLAHLQDPRSRIGHRLRGPEIRERLWRFLLGLLGEVGRKNGRWMAEVVGGARPRGTQPILNDTRREADAVRGDFGGTSPSTSAASGVPIVDGAIEGKPHIAKSELIYRRYDHSQRRSIKGVNRELEKALLCCQKALALNPPDEKLEQSVDQPRRAGDRQEAAAPSSNN